MVLSKLLFIIMKIWKSKCWKRE